MLIFRFRNLLKITGNDYLTSPQLCISNHRYFSENAPSEIEKDSIFSVFKTYGFTETQIWNLITKRPKVLSCHPNKTLEPKLEFFTSVGFSTTDIEQLLTTDPGILKRSLDNQIIPSCKLLKSIVKDNGSVIAAIKRSSWVLKQDLQKYLAPNVVLLQEYGVPNSRISAMLTCQPRMFMQCPDRFKLLVEEVKEMGFEPVKCHFVGAVRTLSGSTKSNLERKWELYRKWGLSDEEIRSAFRRQPCFLAISEEKIRRVMEFLVNEMGWDVSKVTSCPAVVMHSLEKYTVPRCLVVQFLVSKGVMDKDFSLSSVIASSEKVFLKRFVDPYCVEFPEVLNLYGRRVDDLQNSQLADFPPLGKKNF